jgi:hypothetical protein
MYEFLKRARGMEMNDEELSAALVYEFVTVPELPTFVADHQMYKVSGLDDVTDYGPSSDNNVEVRGYETDEVALANLVSSKVKRSHSHRPIIDIDFPAALVPSSTPGHSHLYLDKKMSEKDFAALVEVMHRVGIIADGNLNQWDRHCALFVRTPWVKKKEVSS